ncbi:OTU domain-containing protein 1 [Ostrinia furnacalis]|uniref:OTU domain-containing protein 1 n=1 Tax=Ostrinia furnacalis TaxID=93504 RepID=UPI00103EFF29|nr:OTU domain-containing protein 1 [Ostrinia furnacalis]
MARRLIPIRGDGNCMFRSVSYCVYGTQERHREIRMRVVDRIVANWHWYKDFIIGDTSYGWRMQSSSDYRRQMSRDGEYAGHVELHCVSEIFGDYTFKVHRDGCSRTIDYGRGRTVKHLLFSGFLDAGHYSVLEYY